MPLGRVIAPGEFARLVEEELAQLLAATSTNVKLLTSDELDRLRTSARKAVERRLRGATVVSSSARQRVEISPTTATDLWDDSTVRAVRDADDLADELRSVRAEFASPRTDIDEGSGLLHRKACVVLAASRKPVNETTYMQALAAVSSEEARRHTEGDVAEHVRAAEALSDAAEARLASRGIHWASDGFEDLYIAEITAVAKESGLTYRTYRGV